MLGPASTAVWAGINAGSILDGDPVRETLSWVPSLGLEIDLLIDQYALLFLLVVGVAGTAIFLHAAKYFSSTTKVATFAGTMTLFAGAMVGLVSADHLLALFVFWELTTITSYLLIGYDDENPQARSAALNAALVTGGGGLAMLGGLVLLAEESGSYLISEIIASPPSATGLVTLAWVLVLIGAITKSAQFPFHGWLPGAMAAPTPASAFLHSATMVKAGIFLVGRLSPAAVASTEWWKPVVLTLGFATMVVGGWQALRQYDLKLLLAYGTVSQLGFMFLLIGSGSEALLYGGLALLSAHALFKASLFMTVGTIDHEAGTRDLRRLTGLRLNTPAVFWAGLLAGLSMAAVPLTFGFAAKEAAFDALVKDSTWLIAAAAAASALTAVYTGRFLVGAFGGHHEGHEPAGHEARTPRNALLWSPLILAGAGVAFGIHPPLLGPLVDGATAAISAVEEAGKLVLWPGFVPALAWSLASLTIGGLLVWRWHIVEATTTAVARLSDRIPTADETFKASVSGLLRFADRASGSLQNGSLPFYLGVISLVAVLVPASAVIAVGTAAPPSLPTGGVLEILLGIVVIGAAAGLIFTRSRFAAVILLGAVGFGVAGFYAVLGGPDLSLTQLLVETLVVALFALVLRHLPARFQRRTTARAPRAVVAALVGVFVFAGGLLTAGTGETPAVSDYYLEESVPTAAGQNVVNVILVDFRGFDTLGEITVLATAMLGAAGLVVPIIRRRRSASS